MKVRIPVDSTLLQRDAAINKDSLLVNTFIDISNNKTNYINKRSGFLLGIGGATNGTNYGIYINPNNGIFYYINFKGTPISVSYFGNNLFGDLWSSSFGYFINQQVVYNDGTGNKVYYSAIDNNMGTAPSSSTTTTIKGNIYWSLQPFGPTRYYGIYIGSGPTTASKMSAALAAYSAFEPYQTCPTQFPATNLWKTFVGLGSGDIILVNQFVDSSLGACTGTPIDQGIVQGFPGARVITL